ERKEANLLGIVERELDDSSDLLVVDAVYDGDDRNDLDTGAMQVVDGFQLHVEQLPTLRWAFAALPMPSNCRYAYRMPASAACCANSKLLANSIPLVAACTLL